MKQIILTLLAALLPSLAMAQTAIVFDYDPSATLYARLYTSSSAAAAVAFTPGTSGNTRLYTISDSALTGAGLTPASVAYPFTVFVGTPSTSASDTPVGAGVTVVSPWSQPLASYNVSGTMGQAVNWLKAAFASSGVFSEPALAEAPTGGGGGGGDPVAADVVDDSRTWFATDYRARNIITVGDNFEGTFALQPDLNPGTTILTVDSVSITGAATVTATDLSVNRAKTRAHFTVPALTTTGTYTVVVTVTTVDGQVIPTTATLKVQ